MTYIEWLAKEAAQAVRRSQTLKKHELQQKHEALHADATNRQNPWRYSQSRGPKR